MTRRPKTAGRRTSRRLGVWLPQGVNQDRTDPHTARPTGIRGAVPRSGNRTLSGEARKQESSPPCLMSASAFSPRRPTIHTYWSAPGVCYAEALLQRPVPRTSLLPLRPRPGYKCHLGAGRGTTCRMIDVLRFVVGLAADVVRGRAGLVASSPSSCASTTRRVRTKLWRSSSRFRVLASLRATSRESLFPGGSVTTTVEPRDARTARTARSDVRIRIVAITGATGPCPIRRLSR